MVRFWKIGKSVVHFLKIASCQVQLDYCNDILVNQIDLINSWKCNVLFKIVFVATIINGVKMLL